MNYRKFQRDRRDRIKKDTGLILKDLSECPTKLEPGQHLKTAAVVRYRGYTAIIDTHILENGDYRSEFFKQTGVPLPTSPLDVPEPTSFCPNLTEVIDVNLDTLELS